MWPLLLAVFQVAAAEPSAIIEAPYAPVRTHGSAAEAACVKAG